MSVLVFVETETGKAKGTSLEAISFASELASSKGDSVTALILGNLDESAVSEIGSAGADKVLNDPNSEYDKGMIAPTASAVAKAFESEGSNLVVFSKSSLSDSVAARISIKCRANLATNLVELPIADGENYKVKRSIFTGKAMENAVVKGPKVAFTIKKGATGIKEIGKSATKENVEFPIDSSDLKSTITGSHKSEGDILLPEADLVVSGGRGMKGPEHWGMIEDLANTLGAATGCSKPVSDMGWRPHHEHVGQTGVKVSPNLYVAVGISGAIQHLAGVNSSKVIVVINKDSEAPFFKAANYGIVGDAFDVVPKLNEALKGAN